MTDLRALYGIDFPDELFAFRDWHAALDGEAKRAFHDVLGLSLHGPFDALSGKLDGLELRYPAVLHWRYQYDPPEMFTVMTGNVDGLHWGYWFDDPGRLPPVVASFYARDSVELTEHASLAHALATHIADTRRGLRENRRADRGYAAEYDRDLAALDALDAVGFARRKHPAREPVAETPEGMGIVVAPEQLAAWTRPETIERTAIVAFVDAEIAAGRPGTALLVGRTLWDGAKSLALDVLARAYAALDREPLRVVALAHRAHPMIPSLDITKYKVGDYTDLADALAHPADVRTLTVHFGAKVDGDYSSLVELRELDLAANKLTALPASMAACRKLEILSLFNNELTAFPALLAELPALRELTLGRNRLASVDGIERCAALEEIDLFDNPIARLPAELSGLARLRRINLAKTLLQADEHARLRAAVPGIEIQGEPAPSTAGAKPYSPKTTFVAGDAIAHPTFGGGVVRTVLGDGRIEVEFVSGSKTLAHARR